MVQQELHILRVKVTSLIIPSGIVWHRRENGFWTIFPQSVKAKVTSMCHTQSWLVSDFAVRLLPVESAEALFEKYMFPLDFLLSNAAVIQTGFACETWHHLSLRLYMGRKITSLLHVSIFFPFFMWQQQEHMMEWCPETFAVSIAQMEMTAELWLSGWSKAHVAPNGPWLCSMQSIDQCGKFCVLPLTVYWYSFYPWEKKPKHFLFSVLIVLYHT